ncbi:MAG: ATP-binding cassette domain-containing protein [Rothia sp. (in: high G+C Gram-positive bacteria)]|uniref:ABC transporter ATP-binding protein/permease n=1 Tax=Rothia sp. (in: high G+C Gram-positive bacteria) TaxID=1885016 RepID=UPI0026DEFA61|nr:ABC transporter ATP-binding protein/permease [Rothia sp. (in: high G+C Gram-positive bacteria)]MDO5750809.1 ATP-binding cassette domain-containing protein [Rothia sp. (in: high G+C Gram-positive bacteria)]
MTRTPQDPRTRAERTPAIELRGITRTFEGNPRPVLNNIDLTVYPGEFVAIIGPSGSGKSTLLNALGLLDTPTSGGYYLFGQKTGELSERARDKLRRDTIGFIFQSSNMLLDESSTVNAAMGLRVQGVPHAERMERTLDTLRFLGLEERATTRTKYLSGGEKQRCAIARAVATRPPLVLADEPTGNLDSVNSANVVDILRRINASGCTVLVITHDPEVASAAQRVIRIDDGVLSEESTAENTVDTEPITLPLDNRTLAEVDQRALGAPGIPAESSAPSPKVKHEKASFFQDDSVEALSALTSRPLRTLLLGLSFALGVGGLVSASSMSESANYQVNQRLLGSEQSTLTIGYKGGEPSQMLSTEREGESATDIMRTIASVPYVKNASYSSIVAPADVRITRLSPYEEEPKTAISLVNMSRERLDQIGARINPETLRQLEYMNSTLDSKDPQAAETTRRYRGAILSLGAAKALSIIPESSVPDRVPTPPSAQSAQTPEPKSLQVGGLPQLNMDTSIWINGEMIPVVGLYDPGDSYEYTNSVLVDPELLVRSGHSNVSFVAESERGYGKAVAKAIPLALKPDEPGKISVEAPSDLLNLRATIASDLGLYVGVLSGILLVLASLSAATAMYLSVQSRTMEIALRRAIGSSKWLIARIFLLEGAILGVLGGSLGAAVGMGATLLLAQTQGWQAILSPASALLGMGVGAATGLLSSAYPAWVASRKNPADAMRG